MLTWMLYLNLIYADGAFLRTYDLLWKTIFLIWLKNRLYAERHTKGYLTSPLCIDRLLMIIVVPYICSVHLPYILIDSLKKENMVLLFSV